MVAKPKEMKCKYKNNKMKTNKIEDYIDRAALKVYPYRGEKKIDEIRSLNIAWQQGFNAGDGIGFALWMWENKVVQSLHSKTFKFYDKTLTAEELYLEFLKNNLK